MTDDINYRQLAEWFARGDTGASTRAIVARVCGFEIGAHEHPLDLDDFGRCARLLENIPSLREGFDGMREVSPTWAALVEVWTNLTVAYAQSCALRRRCRIRYNDLVDRMKSGGEDPLALDAIWRKEHPVWVKKVETADSKARRLLAKALAVNDDRDVRQIERDLKDTLQITMQFEQG